MYTDEKRAKNMYSIGDKIIYGENGVCIVEKIAPLAMSGSEEKLYYYLRPVIGTGDYFAPVDTSVFMRSVIGKEEAVALIQSIPEIEPAVCNDSRFNHVDAFYKEIFKKHTPEAMVSIIKGLHLRMAEKKTKSTRAEATMKRAKEILHGELGAALGMDYKDVEEFITSQIGELL